MVPGRCYWTWPSLVIQRIVHFVFFSFCLKLPFLKLLCYDQYYLCDRFEPRSHFISRLSMLSTTWAEVIFRLWRWLPLRLSKRWSVSTTTGLRSPGRSYSTYLWNIIFLPLNWFLTDDRDLEYHVTWSFHCLKHFQSKPFYASLLKVLGHFYLTTKLI